MSVDNVYRSPFQGTGADGSLYTSIQGNGSATFNVAGTKLSLIWGSPDYYNNLAVYSGANGSGMLLETINGASILPANGSGFSFVTISENTKFGSVVLSNTPGINAFEVSTFVSSVPLPASAPLFGAALLALGVAGYGMKRKGSTTARTSIKA